MAENREPRKRSISTCTLGFYRGRTAELWGRGRFLNKCFWVNWISHKENEIKVELAACHRKVRS